MSINLTHNFDGKKFMWLYAKYACGCNPEHHCTNAIRGRYSKRFSRLNKDFKPGQTIVLDEFPADKWDAIYICGVSKNGYAKHENYPHNVHVAIVPRTGASDHWEFENWRMDLQGGVFEYVPDEDALDSSMYSLPQEYTTCRMFRWAVLHYSEQVKSYAEEYIRRLGYNYCALFSQGGVSSLRIDYKSRLAGGDAFSEEKFLEWVINCLRDGDAVYETFYGEFEGAGNKWILDYLGWPDTEFEEGVEKYIKEHFLNAK